MRIILRKRPFLISTHIMQPVKTGRFRYIGGYSMGGFAALHVGLRNPEMFSKIGGHSPTLFLDTYVTPEIDRWLFPTEEARRERDPVLLAETANLEGIQVFIDTGYSRR